MGFLPYTLFFLASFVFISLIIYYIFVIMFKLGAFTNMEKPWGSGEMEKNAF